MARRLDDMRLAVTVTACDRSLDITHADGGRARLARVPGPTPAALSLP